MMRPKLKKGPGEAPKLMLRLSPGLKAELERLAREDRRTLSEYVRLVLEDHVKGTK